MQRGPTYRDDHAYRFGVWARVLVLGVSIAFWGVPSLAEDGGAPSVMSLDYCADQYVLGLADRAQVKGLSRGADKAYSYYSERAKGLPRLYGTVDEVLYFKPDVIVQTWGLPARMKELAESHGIIAIEAEYGSDPDVVFRNVRRIGSSFGQEARAEELVSDYQTRLAALDALPKLSVRAAYITPSGVTSGTGTFVDEIIMMAGFQSWAASRDLKGWQTLPLEDLILDPPDLFVASFFDTNKSTQSNWSVARHGRLYQMMAERPTVDLPGRFLACNGLFLTDAAERIRSGAEALLEMQSSDLVHQAREAR